jgi:hypothetical protein
LADEIKSHVEVVKGKHPFTPRIEKITGNAQFFGIGGGQIVRAATVLTKGLLGLSQLLGATDSEIYLSTFLMRSAMGWSRVVWEMKILYMRIRSNTIEGQQIFPTTLLQR